MIAVSDPVFAVIGPIRMVEGSIFRGSYLINPIDFQSLNSTHWNLLDNGQLKLLGQLTDRVSLLTLYIEQYHIRLIPPGGKRNLR